LPNAAGKKAINVEKLLDGIGAHEHGLCVLDGGFHLGSEKFYGRFILILGGLFNLDSKMGHLREFEGIRIPFDLMTEFERQGIIIVIQATAKPLKIINPAVQVLYF
jgi:hypothetical protein